MIRLSLVSFLTVSAAWALTPQEELAQKVPAARAILDGWQQKNPERGERKLHIIYWTPSDREPAPRYRERLSAIFEDIRRFYGAEMKRSGFGERTFNLNHDKDGLVQIHLVKGKNPYSQYESESGGEIRKECVEPLKAAGIDVDKETIVIFCNMSNWDPAKRVITQNSPYYAGGTNRNGTAWQVDSPILDLAQLANKGDNVKDGQYGNISIGRYNSIFIGGIAHELGHALSLPHNVERDDEKEAFGVALMGSGNREYGTHLRGEGKGSFINLAHALQLASHPLFCGSVKGMFDKPTAKPSDLAIKAEGKTIVITGKVTSEVPVYGVLAYNDPAGGGDYDSPTATAVPDKNGKFTLTCTDLVANKAGELRLFFLESNGIPSGSLSSTPYRYSYTVKADGTAELGAIQAQLLLKPLIEAAQKPDQSLAAVAKAINFFGTSPEVKGAAESIYRQATRNNPPTSPDQVKENTLALAASKWSSAKTGYGPAKSGMLPEEPWVFVSGGKLFRDGLYAHAPANYTYQLGGTWKTLSGSCGLADGHDGSVDFRILGDGKELLQTKTIKEGKVTEFKVDVSGVKELQLISGNGGDDTRSDWAVWLDPTLSR